MNFFPPILGIALSFALYSQEQAGAEISQLGGSPQEQQARQPEFRQGDDALPEKEPRPNYSYPAAVKLTQGYDLSVTASYLYWYAGEEGLDLATTAVFNSATNTSVAPATGGSVIFQDFSYSSGFKVGVDWISCCDQWVWRADYTWYHRNTTTSQNASAQSGGTGVLYLTDWFYQTSAQNQGVAATNIRSKWKLDLDWLDIVVGRPFYSGRKFTLNPFFGLKASWITQTLDLSANGILNFSPSQPMVTSRNHSHNWALGPRAGIGARYLLGQEIRIQGGIAGNLLYTKYTDITHSEEALTSGGTGIAYSSERNVLRPSVEMNLGLGWGYYFSRDRYHLDLSATYDFNYLWSQNMIRSLNDLNVFGIGSSANDLYLHGLTLTAAFAF